MKYFLDKNSNAELEPLAKIVNNTGNFIKRNDWQKFLKDIVRTLEITSPRIKKTPLFSKEISFVERNTPLTEKTPWGGVALKNVDVEKDFIRKLLVIRRFGILGFEIHRKKRERLKVLEGECLVFYSNHKSRNWRRGKITIAHALPPDKFLFLPRDEHGILALTNCVIEETSTNHLDDLAYIFEADQVSLV